MNDSALAADYAERLDTPMRELKKARLRAAQEAGRFRTGPLTSEYADQVVETALRGLQPR